jgi:hypothetical protein
MSALLEEQSLADNPLVEGLEHLPVYPTSMVVFGATGDLARRKLLPALYNLAHDGALPERIALIGVSRGAQSSEEFRAMARKAIERFSRRRPDPYVLEGLLAEMRYVAGTFDDDDVYRAIDRALRDIDEEAGMQLNLPRDHREARRRRSGQVGIGAFEDRDREAVRLRPGFRARAERPGARGLRGVAGFPD